MLAALGRDGVAGLVDRTCRLARRFADGIRAAGYDVLNDVVLNQVVVDFGDPARTGGHHRRGPERGNLLVRADDAGSGRTAMRVSVSCWNTTEADIDRSVAAVLACASGQPGAGVR